MSRNFGIECEVGGGAREMMSALGIDQMHGYHCGCPQCTPHRSGPTFTCQDDCTADGEFISKVLTYGTTEADTAIDTLADALLLSRAIHTKSQGLHVHVSNDGLRGSNTRWHRLWRLWFRYQDDIQLLASGKYDDVRTYNGERTRMDEVCQSEHEFWSTRPSPRFATGRPYGRGQLNPRTGHDTIEFRIWNATRVGWRIHLAVGVSVALVEAAVNGRVCVEKDDPRSLADCIGPYMTDKSMAGLLRAWTFQEGQAA